MMDAEREIHRIRTSVDSFVESMTDNVRARVQNVTSAVLNRNAGQIPYDESLMERCGADSLDFVDIVYRLEDEFGIELPVDSIQEAVRRGLEHEYEVDGCLSSAALTRLRTLMPEAEPDRLLPGLMARDIPALFTTETFVRMVAWRLLERTGEPAR
jgi:acyl carrier protein